MADERLISEKQRDLMEACRTHKFVLASGPRYSTKCVSPDTLVWCETGLSPISKLGTAAVGELRHASASVLSLDGSSFKPHSVTAFYNSGKRKAVSIKTAMGYEIVCSPNHRLWCECSGNIGFKTAEEIIEAIAEGKHVWLPLLREHSKFARQYQNTAGHNIDESLAYVMGLFVGDGCYTPPILRACRIGFSTNDETIANAVRHEIEGQFLGKLKHRRGCDYEVQSRAFRNFIKACGMAGKYAHEKDVPDVIFNSPKPVIAAFLRGLFDTDGMVCSAGNVRYCTSSPQLSKQVHGLLLALGVRASRYFLQNEYRGAYLICPVSEDEFGTKIGFGLTRKQNRIRKLPKHGRRAFQSYPDSLLVVLRRLHSTRKERNVERLPRNVHRHTIDCVFRGNVSLSAKRIKPLIEVLKGENDSEFQQYWLSGRVWWNEIDSVSLLESPLVDISVPETENFVGNGFINHNTVGGLHCVADHAWRTDRGNIALVSVSQSAGLDSGVWEDLVNTIIPQWISSGIGMKWVKPPYTANVTKKPTCIVSNAYGNQTRIQLDSLKYEHEVESRFKNKRYSMMFVTELSNFKRRKTFDIWGECLRMLHLREDQHLFLGDTNPADEGEESWIYKVWYVMPRLEYLEYVALAKKEGLPVLAERQFKVIQKMTKLLEFQISDNIFATQARIDELVARYSSDPDLYDRYILGLWKKATTDALFANVFKPNIHIIGEHETPGNPDPVILIPEDSTVELKTGNDPGASVNTASVIVEKLFRKLSNGKEQSVFKVLDELCIIGEDHSLDDYTEELCRKLDWWEERMGRKFIWTHWSDTSVFAMKEPRDRKYYHQIIFEASQGRILLQGATKGAGSVKRRVDLLRKLLFEDRIFFSRDKTPLCIEMCRTLRRGTTETQAIAKGARLKHVFDALMYCIGEECYEEMQDMVLKSLKTSRDENSESGIVAVSV